MRMLPWRLPTGIALMDAWDVDHVNWEVLVPTPGSAAAYVGLHLRTFIADEYASLLSFISCIWTLETLLVMIVAAGQTADHAL